VTRIITQMFCGNCGSRRLGAWVLAVLPHQQHRATVDGWVYLVRPDNPWLFTVTCPDCLDSRLPWDSYCPECGVGPGSKRDHHTWHCPFNSEYGRAVLG